MLTSQTPYKIPRIISLALLAATAVAAGALGVNGLVKFDEVKNKAKKEAPAGIDVDIVTGNFVPIGIIVSAACGKLFLTAVGLLVAKPLASRFLHYQAILFALLSMFLLAVVIPFTDFFATRAAEYTVTANGVAVPANVVKAAVGSKTSELEYRQHTPRKSCWKTSLIVYGCLLGRL